MTRHFTAAAAAAAAFSLATVATATPTPISDLTIFRNSLVLDGSLVNVTGIIVSDFRVGSLFDGFHIQMTKEDATGVSGSTQSILLRDPALSAEFLALAFEEGYEVRINNAIFNQDIGPNGFNSFEGVGEVNLQYNDEMTIEVLCSDPTIAVSPGITLCKEVNVAEVVFPIANRNAFYNVRNMLMKTKEDLTIVDLYSARQFQEVGLHAGGKRMVPTQMALPGAAQAAYAEETAKSAWILGKSESLPRFTTETVFPRGGFQDDNDPALARVMRGGQLLAPNVFDATCLVMVSYGKWMSTPTKRGADIIAAELLAYKPTDRLAAPETTPMQVAEDKSKAIVAFAGMNIENYFVTFEGGRGAKDQEMFTLQRNKIFRTMVKINPAVAGLQEMENHPTDAATDDFIQGLNEYAIKEGLDQIYTAIPATPYQSKYAIKNTIIYQTKYVTPIGEAAVLTYDSIENLGGRSRPSVAQTFEVNGVDSRFTLISNHFKSKGPSGGCKVCSFYNEADGTADDECTLARGGGCDQEDGQAFYSFARLASAKELYSEWLSKDPTGEQDKIPEYANRIISVGDMNAYRKEDAIQELMNSGIVNIADRDYNGNAISYVFSGAYGTLDYALATPAMADICGKAAGLETVEWNSNSDESGRIGYSDGNRNNPVLSPGAVDSVYRSSDHDPIVVTCDMPQLTYREPVGHTAITRLTSAMQSGVVQDGDLVTISGVVVADFRQHKSEDTKSINGFHVQMTTASAVNVFGSSQSILVRATDMNSEFFTAAIEEGYEVTIANVTFNSADGENSYNGEAHLEFNSTTTSMTVLCDTPTVTVGTGIKLCAAVNIVELTFPVSDEMDFNMYRNMLMRIPQDMTVTDLYSIYTDNEIGMQQGGKRITPTQIAAPGAAAAAYEIESRKSSWIFGKSQVIARYSTPNVYPPGGYQDDVDPAKANVIRGGQVMDTKFFDATILMMYQGGQYGKWQSVPTKRGMDIVTEQFNLYKPTDRVLEPELSPNEIAGTKAVLAIAGMNVENYFVTFVGGRGAKDQEMFTMQRNKIFRTMVKMNAAVAGLQEMENHPEDAATEDFIQGLNEYAIKYGVDQIYTAVQTADKMVGDGAIKNAIVYQAKYVTPVGDSAVLMYNSTENLSSRTRPSVAQTFTVNGIGSRFTVVSNHFKSKGSSGCKPCSTYTEALGNADDLCVVEGGCDLKDGQGYWSQARLASAEELYDEWLSQDPTGEQNKIPEFANRIISVGDMNSNKMEEAITSLIANGIVNLADRDLDNPLSYQYSGGYATLDYALATPAMAAICGKVAGLETVEWNSNSDESPRIGYSNGDRSNPGVSEGAVDSVFRSSDHDPFVVTCNMGKAQAPTKSPTPTPGTGENSDEDEKTDEGSNDIILFVGGMALMGALLGVGFLLYSGKLAACVGGSSTESRIVSSGPVVQGLKEEATNPKFNEVV